MIGHTVDSKVKRFAKAQRTEKTLITKEFLKQLEEEIERVTILTGKHPANKVSVTTLAVDIPSTPITDRLICDSRIKQTINTGKKKKIPVSKHFLADLNTYVGAIIIASMDLVSGAYLTDLTTGEADVTNAEVASVPSPVDGEEHPPSSTDSTQPSFTPALPREHTAVDYKIHTQGVELTGQMRIFTAKTTQQIEQVINLSVARTFASLGIEGPFTVVIAGTERKKGKPTNESD
jgi:hypothetical protein